MNSRPVGETHDHDVPAQTPLPKPRVTRSRWPGVVVWIVPVLAAVAAGIYLYRIAQRHGPEITITFSDATGLKVRDTPLTFHGVRVGSIASIDLNPDRTQAIVHVQLEKAFETTIARDGGKFWLVKPDLGGGMLSGLSTVISGPYIDCAPGAGDAAFHFEGKDTRPVLLGDGIRVVLHTDRLAHLQVDSPIYYRGMQVGAVQDIRFSSDATQVNVTAFIWERYRKLLRRSSLFWSVSGTDIKGGLFSGISVELSSLRALVAGGIAFATPDDNSVASVPEGTNFTLHDEAKMEWLEWSAKIALPPDSNAGMPAADPGNGAAGTKTP